MVKRNIHEYLGAIDREVLLAKEILDHRKSKKYGDEYLLNSKTFHQVMKLMVDEGIDQFYYGEWWLNRDGNYHNPRAPLEIQSGHYTNLSPKYALGTVFMRQNKYLNPHFRGSE